MYFSHCVADKDGSCANSKPTSIRLPAPEMLPSQRWVQRASAFKLDPILFSRWIQIGGSFKQFQAFFFHHFSSFSFIFPIFFWVLLV